MKEKYKSTSDDFVDCVTKERKIIHSKLSNYLCKRKTLEKAAELFRNKISELETATSDAQQVIDELVDDFVLTNNCDDGYKMEILKIKDVNVPSQFFECWLQDLDKQLNDMETEWNSTITPYLETCQCIFEYSKSLINKHTSQTDRSSYIIEYNPNDKICTKDLQNQVNTQQKFILKNVDIDGKLSFPNLIRAFVISISFMLKNTEIGDDVFGFNEYLQGGKKNYNELVSAFGNLMHRVVNLKAKLQKSPANQSFMIQKYNSGFPPLPDLSELNTNYIQFQSVPDSFTPLNPTKQHFNLVKTSRCFSRPQSKLLAPIYQAPRDDFLRSLVSSYVRYDTSILSQNNPNLSTISSIKANETIAECSSGFTKQQIMRLLSTRKSSSKKHKFSYDRPNIKVKKGGLFSDTNENTGLYRSHSSPNLFENKVKRSNSKVQGRKLSIMQEDTVSRLEFSGIECLDMGSDSSTPCGTEESSRKEILNIPLIKVSRVEERLNNVITNIEEEMNKLGADIISPILDLPENTEIEKVATPKPDAQLIKKTSSLEKIINRFKKVRANVIQKTEEVVEEKENLCTNNNVSTSSFSSRILLPDLLSPSCSSSDNKINNDYLDQLCQNMEKTDCRKPRESLGTALGVDQTFLDQFDIID